MDQIQNSSPFNNNSLPPSASTANNSSASANQARQIHNQQRLLVQQQQQQLYNLLPGPSQLQTSPTSYSPSNTLPPIPTSSAQQQQQYFSSEGLSSPTHTTPPNSATWPLQRTSNSREELHPRQQQQQQQQQYLAQQQARAQHQQQEAQAQAQAQSHPPIKREPMSYSAKDDKSAVASSSGSNGNPARGTEDPMPSTSDFVKKLYKMLEDPAFQSVVCWGPLGDCFVVKDMNEFTKSILPRMFKHSNFASFVRQLNKYDFHKVKNTDDNQFGEHSWTFRHPDFHADRRDALENIKRKVPAARKPTALSSSSALPPHSSAGHPYANGRRSSSPPSLHPAAYPGVHPGHPHYNATTAQLTSEIQRLKEEGDDLRGRIRNLERNYESVLVEMVGFQRGMAQQDGLMQSLIAYFLGSESGKLKASSNNNGASGSQLSPSTSRLQQTGSQPTPQQQLQAQIHSQLQQSQHAQAALQAQLSAVRERRASIEAAEGAPQSQQVQVQAQQAQQQSQGSLAGALGGLGQISDQNPFLPPQTVQRILSGAPAGGLGNNLDPGGGQGGGRMTPDILGRATLLQMSELSRRAAYLNAQGIQAGQGAEGGRLWAGMNFPPSSGGEGSGSGGQGPIQPQGPDGQKLTRAEALAQIRDLHRERLSQGGWANAPAPSVPLGLGGVGAVGGVGSVGLGGVQISGQQRLGQRRSMSEERMAYAQQQQQQGQPGQGGEMMQVDPQEAEDERGRRARRRQSEGGVGLRGSSSGLSLGPSGEGGDGSQAQSPEEYVMPSPPPNSAAASGQGTASGSPQQQAQQQRQQSGTPNPWASLMNMNLNFANASGSGGPGGPFIVDSQPYNGPTASSGGVPGFSMDDENNGLTHEGLQVYTVGHLLPRGVGMGGAEDARGSWSFDASGLAAGGMLGSMEGGNQGGEQQQYASGSYAGDDGEEEVVRPTPSNALVPGASSHSMVESSSAASSSTTGAGRKLRVRRSTFVPGWAVPPRVLLVDDDAVSRKLSSKFLKVFGCTIDVAVDGIGAVNKMNLEKYDLVLMDIVMPKLDGVSATNLIRKFDQGTPIISMTSNSKPNEIMTYYSSGMNDILPKPFTKEGLLDMLEKHLMHLKVIQQLSKVPRSIGVPPLSDANFEQALTTSANSYMQQQGQSSNLIEGPSGSSSSDPNAGGVVSAPSPFNFNFNFGDGEDDGRINPLAGMGLTDEQYSMILQNIVNGDGFMGIPDDIANGGNPSGSGLVEVPVGVSVGGSEKRPLDDPSEDGRDGKRGRFEVIE